MAIWYGTQISGGESTVKDIIQDNYFDEFGTRADHVEIIHFYFHCDGVMQIEVDGRTQWLEADTEIEFSTELDLKKMPDRSFKILTSGVLYQYNIILR